MLLAVLRQFPAPMTFDATQKVAVGMTRDDVRELLGEPHSTTEYPNGTVGWYYNLDIVGFSFCGVLFDQDDRVSGVHF